MCVCVCVCVSVCVCGTVYKQVVGLLRVVDRLRVCVCVWYRV